MRDTTKALGALALAGVAAVTVWSGCSKSSSDCAALGLPEGCGGGSGTTSGTGGKTTTSSTTTTTTSATVTGTGGSTTTTSATGGGGTGGGTGGTSTTTSATGGTGGTGGGTTTTTSSSSSATTYLPLCTRKFWGDVASEKIRGIVSDATGTTIAGDFQGTFDVGQGPLKAAASGSTFVARLDTALGALWSHPIDASMMALAGNAQGQSVLVGTLTAATTILDCGALDPANGTFFIAKLGVDGKCTAARNFAAAVTRASVAMDGAGNVVVAGGFLGGASFATNLVSQGMEDIFVASFDTNLNALQARSFGAANNDAATSVAIDAAGSAYVTGTFQGTINFNSGDGNLDSMGHVGVFTTRFNSSLGGVWSRHFASSNDASSAGLVVLSSGGVAVGGTFSGNIALGAAQPLMSPGGFFLARLDGNGANTEQSVVGGLVASDISAMAVSATDEVVIAGSKGNGLYLGRLTAGSMTPFEVVATGTGASHRATGAAYSNLGKLLLGGYFDGSLAAVDPLSISSAGAEDALLFEVCFPP